MEWATLVHPEAEEQIRGGDVTFLAVEPQDSPAIGRPRDPTIDAAVLDETLRQLASRGFAALSIASVAAGAGTSRPAIYRRWPDKESLVVDAIARLAQVAPPEPSGDPFEDLVMEMEHFRHCITLAGSLPVAGLMLGDGVRDRLRAEYRDAIVAPRRARIRACLDAAIERGLLDADADVLVASSFLTGSWYALALAGTDPPPDWARRTVALVWRACGGEPQPATRGIPTTRPAPAPPVPTQRG